MLSSCLQHSAPKPKPFLNERKMVKLLTEMQLVEANLQQQRAPHGNMDSLRLYTNVAYFELFGKDGLTKESFEANLYYHVYNSRNLERIYTKIHENWHLWDSLRREF
jgi:hypothetical protein